MTWSRSTTPRVRVILSSVLVFALALDTARAAGQRAGLKIVVIEGEDAVNIIQQRTAVAPIVEVRDRNDLPVAGVVVGFAIVGTTASFPGGQALTVTTDAAGRATASGLTPTANGAFQIDVTATYQGQTATASITQSNFATVQEAAQAGRTPGQSGSGANAAAGGAAGTTAGIVGATPAATTAGRATAGAGGGGMSAATIAIIAAGAAGGAVAAKKTLGGSSSSSSSSSSNQSGPTSFNVAGPFSGTIPVALTAGCVMNFGMSGTLRMALTQQGSAVTGTLTTSDGISRVTTTGCPPGIPVVFPDGPFSLSGPVTGSPSNLQYSQSFTDQAGTTTFSFSGSLNGRVVTGALTSRIQVTNGPGGSTTIPVTLR